MPIFADAFIPLSPVAPLSQVALLIFIVIIEGLIIGRGRKDRSHYLSFWMKTFGANVATAILGVLLVCPVALGEGWLLYGWGSDTLHPLKWYAACLLYGFAIPWSVWLFCYHLSWRVEFWLLRRLNGFGASEAPSAWQSVRDAHRWSYALLALPVLAATLTYWITIFHPLE